MCVRVCVRVRACVCVHVRAAGEAILSSLQAQTVVSVCACVVACELIGSHVENSHGITIQHVQCTTVLVLEPLPFDSSSSLEKHSFTKPSTLSSTVWAPSPTLPLTYDSGHSAWLMQVTAP